MPTFEITYEEVLIMKTFVTAKDADDAEHIFREKKIKGEIGLENVGDDCWAAMDECEIDEIIYGGVTDVEEE